MSNAGQPLNPLLVLFMILLLKLLLQAPVLEASILIIPVCLVQDLRLLQLNWWCTIRVIHTMQKWSLSVRVQALTQGQVYLFWRLANELLNK